MSSTSPNLCPTQYVQNQAQVTGIVNFLAVAGDTTSQYTFTAYRPFLMIGKCANGGGAVPNGGVGEVAIGWPFYTEQFAFPYQTLMQSMLSANISGANQSGFLTYSTIPNYGKNYSQYLQKYLNDAIIPMNLNRFLYPGVAMKDFWDFNTTQFDPGGTPYLGIKTTDYMALFEMLIKNSNKNLWLPPGIYTIESTTGGNTDPYIAGWETTFGNANLDQALLMVLELDNTNGL